MKVKIYFVLLWIEHRTLRRGPGPMAARSKAYVCCRSPAEIVGSNPTRGVGVCWKCCVLSSRGPWVGLITRLEESYGVWCVSECDREASIMRRALAHWGLLRQGKKFVPMNSSFLIIPTDFEIIKQMNFCVTSYYENGQDNFCNVWFWRPLASLAHSYLSRIERRNISTGFFFNSIWGSLKLSEYSDFQPYLRTLNTNLHATNR